MSADNFDKQTHKKENGEKRVRPNKVSKVKIMRNIWQTHSLSTCSSRCVLNHLLYILQYSIYLSTYVNMHSVLDLFYLCSTTTVRMTCNSTPNAPMSTYRAAPAHIGMCARERFTLHPNVCDGSQWSSAGASDQKKSFHLGPIENLDVERHFCHCSCEKYLQHNGCKLNKSVSI